jgi:hypothetical protein
MNNANQEVPRRATRFVESPLLWGAIGLIAGSTASVLPIHYFFVAAGLLICVELVRVFFWNDGEDHVGKILGSAAICSLVAFGLFVFYRVVPKPPTTDELAQAIATRLIILQNTARPAPPGAPTITVTTVDGRTVAEVVADKVLAIVKKATGP